MCKINLVLSLLEPSFEDEKKMKPNKENKPAQKTQLLIPDTLIKQYNQNSPLIASHPQKFTGTMQETYDRICGS